MYSTGANTDEERQHKLEIAELRSLLGQAQSDRSKVIIAEVSEISDRYKELHLKFCDGWGNQSTESSPIPTLFPRAYCKVKNGLCMLFGMVTGKPQTPICQLPPEARPAHLMRFVCHDDNGKMVTVDVDENGLVTCGGFTYRMDNPTWALNLAAVQFFVQD